MSFVIVLSYTVFGGGPCTTSQRNPRNFHIFLNMVQCNFLHYRAMAYKTLVTVDIKEKMKNNKLKHSFMNRAEWHFIVLSAPKTFLD
jgi:hypothetical protein